MLCAFLPPGAPTGGVMQAFLKGASVQPVRPQKDKAAAGSSSEKKTKAIPWVEK